MVTNDVTFTVVCDSFFFFFQAEDGIRDIGVTGVQTCALPISTRRARMAAPGLPALLALAARRAAPPVAARRPNLSGLARPHGARVVVPAHRRDQIGRAACRERGEISVVAVSLKKKKETTMKIA